MTDHSTSQINNTQFRSVDRMSRIKDNEDRMTTIHLEKSQRSNVFFKDAKITSCSQVLVKNGQAVAVAFKTSPRPKDHSLDRSPEKLSMSA